jgi:enoyl-[acyl-carrier protein] reductase I
MNDFPLQGKTGLVFGIANERSLAFATARAWTGAGARLIVSYQDNRHKDKVLRLVGGLSPDIPCLSCDVNDDTSIASFFDSARHHTDRIDMVLHSVAHAPARVFSGRFTDTTRQDFLATLDTSAYSLIALARAVEPLMSRGGTLLTMTYEGSRRVMPHYKVMGIAKAALESAARYLAYELGPADIRVNCLSPGPIPTLAARSIPGFSERLARFAESSPLRRTCRAEETAALATFLCTDQAAGITGQVFHVDAGHSIMGA